MTRLLLALLLLTTAYADPPPNADYQALLYYIEERNTPRLPEKDARDRLLEELRDILLLGREALNPAYSTAKRAVYARQYLEATDPVPVDPMAGTVVPTPSAQP